MRAGLAASELKALLDFVAELNVLRSPEALMRFLIQSLPRLVPADHASFTDFAPAHAQPARRDVSG